MALSRPTRRRPHHGIHPWPIWHPLPEWLPPGSLRLGLTTALAGVLLGPLLLRLVNALHCAVLGEEVFGSTGPALLLLAGGFLGWQPIVVALVLAFVFEEPLSCLTRTTEVAFGLALIAAIVLTWFGWRWLGTWTRPYLFSPGWVGPLLLAIVAAFYAQGWARKNVKKAILQVADSAAP